MRTEEVDVVVVIRGEYLPVHGTEEVEAVVMVRGEYLLYLYMVPKRWK